MFVDRLLLEIAEKLPDKTVFANEQTRASYAEICGRAVRFASALHS